MFKQGWNTVLLETISSTSLRVSTVSVPEDVSWRFIPYFFINFRIDKLDVGDSVNLDIISSDGYQYQNSEFDWTTADSSLLEVSSSGIVTAKEIGSTQVTATLKGMPSNRSSSSITVMGFVSSGSTYNIENQTLGTSISLKYSHSYVLSPTETPIVIIGPEGWNNNQPLNWTYKYNSFAPDIILSDIPAISGVYTVRQAKQATGGSKFLIDATQKLPTPTNLTAQTSYENYATLRWKNVDPTPVIPYEYFAEMVDAQSGAIIKAKASINTMSEYQFYGITVDKSRIYKLRLYSQSTNNSNGQFLGASVASVILDFRPEFIEIKSLGGVVSGGYSVVIRGANFDLNTRVYFGSAEATSKVLNSSSTLSVVVPAVPAGTVDVTLQNSRGTSVISDLSRFTFFSSTEFTSVQPRKLLKGNNGVIHFLETSNSSVLKLTTVSETSVVSSVTIPNISGYDARDLVIDNSGNFWISFPTKFIKVTPNSVISEIPMPNGVSPAGFAFGADGSIWFLRTDSLKIGRMQPDGSSLAEFIVPTEGFGSSFSISSDIVLAGDNNFWFTKRSAALGRISSSGAVTILTNITNYSDGNILLYNNVLWFGSVTRVTYTGDALNAGLCGGFSVAVGSDGYFWCAKETGVLGRLPISNSASSVRSQNVHFGTINSVNDIISDSNGKIWYIAGNKVGVLTP